MNWSPRGDDNSKLWAASEADWKSNYWEIIFRIIYIIIIIIVFIAIMSLD